MRGIIKHQSLSICSILAVFILQGSEVLASSRRVFFVEPSNKATVGGKVKVKFGLEGMSLLPAGKMVENSGHHHLIIDGGSIGTGAVIPNDAKNLHFGKGQTETEIELSPGPHTLTLQFADGAHKSYGPDLSSTISIEVKK